MGLMFYLQVQPHFHTAPYLLYLQLVIFWHEYVKRQMWATFYYYYLATYKYIHPHIQKNLLLQSSHLYIVLNRHLRELLFVHLYLSLRQFHHGL